jgi:hypothetical protein
MYYTTHKEPIYDSTLKWYINQLSFLEKNLSNRELKLGDSILKKDLNQVKRELNLTISELLSSGDNQYRN